MILKFKKKELMLFFTFLLLGISLLFAVGTFGKITKFLVFNNDPMSNTATPTVKSAENSKPSDVGAMHHVHVTNEREFLYHMIPHHVEAIETSRYLMEKIDNVELEKFADNVIKAQTDEIKLMEGWYRDWYKEEYTVNKAYKRMMGNIFILAGEELEQEYINGMILHHEGAVQMSEQIKTISNKKEILDLADNIIKAQSEEINYLKGLAK